jgi:hypothetical protein
VHIEATLGAARRSRSRLGLRGWLVGLDARGLLAHDFPRFGRRRLSVGGLALDDSSC